MRPRSTVPWSGAAEEFPPQQGSPLIVTGDAFDELDFEYATEVAEKAVRSMSQQRVPPTPNNFHTWFKYSLGTSPDLKRAIDILVGNKRKFDATTHRDLFAAYVGPHTADDTDLNHVSQT